MSHLLVLAVLFGVMGVHAFSSPGGYVLLSPSSIDVNLKKDKVTLTFDLPCFRQRAVEAATLIEGSDDSGDFKLTFGWAYPAGYCMDFEGDPKGKPMKGYKVEHLASNLGITKDVEVVPLEVLKKKR